MAIPLTDTFGFTPNKPNIDKRYLANNGQPYTSVSAAETALASRLVETCIGLTVLVADENDPDYPKAKEYWVQPKGTTPVTYGFVEKGAGTTDYAALDNKPTISDGGQGSAQIPLSGNIKVTASTASGENAGVTITQGQSEGEIAMNFTLPKGADGANGAKGDTGEQGPTGPQGIQGMSAFEVWKETTGRTTATEPEYIADLQTKVAKWIPVAYEALSPAPFIGDTVTFSTTPSNPIDGAIVIMPNAASNATATMMFAVSSDGQTPATYTYTYIGDMDNVDVTGLLGQSDVDGTQLKNPTAGQVAKAEDVMPLSVKLKGITLEESKVVIESGVNFFDESYIKPSDGKIYASTGSPANGVLCVPVTGVKEVRFLGFRKAGTTSGGGSAYGFSDTQLTTENKDTFSLPEWTEYGNGATADKSDEYIVSVPEGMNYFVCTIRKYNNSAMTIDSFYCYLQTGESVNDRLAHFEPDEKLSTTSEKPIANKTVTKFLFDNFTKDVERGRNGEYDTYTSPIKQNGDLYAGGQNAANVEWYPVRPNKTYIVNTWQVKTGSWDCAYAGFYNLPAPLFAKSDIVADNVCKGKDGDDTKPYTYRDDSILGDTTYLQNVILTAPEGANYLILVARKINGVVVTRTSCKEVGVENENNVNADIDISKNTLTPTPNAMLLKNVLKNQNRNYYIEEVDINSLSGANSYNLKSYIDRKIATIPQGKHFMLWTDAHIDYVSYGEKTGIWQNAVPVMAYIKEKLGIQYIINGGDSLGVSNSKYKAAAIIEKYMNECYEAFGRGMINVFGNHDFNAPASTKYPNISTSDTYINDVEGWKRMFLPMELYGDAVYAEDVLKNINDLYEEEELITEEQRDRLVAWAKMTYYIDDKRQKIRYFVVVGDDPATIARSLIHGSSANFMPFIDFFANALINIPKDYDVCLVSHQLLSNTQKQHNNPWYAFYKVLSGYKTKTTVRLGNGTLNYDANIFYNYVKTTVDSVNKYYAKYITSHSFDDNGKRTYDMSSHQGSGRVFAVGGHYHVDRAAFVSLANGVFDKTRFDGEGGINGDTSDGNILYDLEVPSNNAYAEAWADAILNIEFHCTTIGGAERDDKAFMIVHRYKKNGVWIEDPNVYSGADWTGNEVKVYGDYYGHRKSIMWPIGGPETYKTADGLGTPFESVSAAEQSFPTSLDNWVGTKILIKESESAQVKVYHVVEKEEGGTTTYSIELLNYGRGTFGHYFDDATNNEVLADDSPLSINRNGNVNEICCDVITITDDNHVVCTRFGAGFDRDYKLPSIPSYSIYAESSETTEQTTENAGE